jgi:low affinity Fe/Cu permease
MKKPRRSRTKPRKERGGFQRFARATARASGGPPAFGMALGVIVVWGVTGPLFHFSDTWQLVINTGTTIVTFLMVFLIQNTQNRDSEAIQIKLDELLRATDGCHNTVMDIEELTEEELDKLKMAYAQLAKKATTDLRRGRSDIGAPELKETASVTNHRARKEPV